MWSRHTIGDALDPGFRPWKIPVACTIPATKAGQKEGAQAGSSTAEAELKAAASARFGELRQLVRAEYVREVTEASAEGAVCRKATGFPFVLCR